MRLREVQKLIDETIPRIEFKSTQSQNSTFKVSGIQQLITAIDTIKSIGIFQNILAQITSLEEVYLNAKDTFVIERGSHAQLEKAVRELRQSLEIVSAAFRDLIPKQDPYSISFRLPPISDLKDVNEIAEQLDKILSQAIVNQYVNGRITVQYFDSGSLWFEIFVGTGAAVKMIAFIAKTIILLKREHLKNQQMLESVRGHNIANDLIEKMGEQLAQHHKQLLQMQIRETIKAGGIPENDHEAQERIRYCIEQTTVLIDKGLQIFPSETSSDEMKSEFPDFTKPLELMLPELKALTGESSQPTNPKK